MVLLRRTGLVLLFFVSSVLVAAALAYGFQEFFPYEFVRRTSPEQRFLVWEGLLWMSGLVLILFGFGAALGSLHLLNQRMPGLDEIHSFARSIHERRFQFSLLPWWMLCTGAILLSLAIHARAQLPM